MNSQVSSLYKEYGQYINRFRSFPMIHDGLKIVERRLLYSLYSLAKDNFTKSAKIVGFCIGNFHPHGDISAYSSLVTLVNGKLAIGQGNWGSSIGVQENPAAAQRYTEVKSDPSILKMAFEYIKYVPFQELELESEPVYLPTMLPICLLNIQGVSGIGFGSRCVFPSYKKEDLIKRLSWLLKIEKTEPIIRPITDCEYLSKDEDFQQLLTTGRAKIDVKGKYIINPPKSIVINSIPGYKKFSAIFKKFQNEIQNEKSIGFTDESAGNQTKVRLSLMKRSYTLEAMKKKLDDILCGSINYECNMCDENGKIFCFSIDQMLLSCYANYKRIVELVMHSDIQEKNKQINELNLIARIKSVLNPILKEYADDFSKVVSLVATQLGIDEIVIKELFEKYTLARFLRIKTETQRLQEQIVTISSNLARIDEYIWLNKYTQV